ncbi:MAG: hypothetical protein JWM34_295 [Ilumatobacteraceae bacterium]|nr:hypothetical protein [Ilumatobacteraceae bacterium]
MRQTSVSAHRMRFRMRTRLRITALVAATSIGAVATSFTAADAAPVGHTAPQAAFDDPMAHVAVQALADLAAYTHLGDIASLNDYVAERNQIATELATRLDMEPTAMILAWQAADMTHQTVLMAAFSQLGVPYHHNTSKAGIGFDCSGLTTYAWGVAGVTLTRQSGAQIRAAAPRTQDTAMAGDIVYYPGHVMLWLGVDNAIVHAPYTGRDVEVDTVAQHRSVRYGNPIG